MIDVGGTLKGGRWRLEEQIGSGGMAVVFRAHHRNGSRAAIKVLKEEFADIEDIRARFLREGYAANAVGHPGAVQILDDDVEDGIPYIVMELLEGKPLTQHLRASGGRLPLAEVLEISDALLEILDAAHRNGVIHRDVKPGNIFLTKDRRVKLLDFGFAKISLPSTDAQTGVGALLGTPGFIAPERLLGDPSQIDARTDVWSTGATIFKLATGKGIFSSIPAHAVLEATATRSPPSLGDVAPGLPASFVRVVDRALAMSPADRWQSAAEMRAALRETDEDEATRVGTSFNNMPVADEADSVDDQGETRVSEAKREPPPELPRRAPKESPDAATLPPASPPKRKARRGPAVALPRVYEDDDDAGVRRGATVVMANAPARAPDRATPVMAPPVRDDPSARGGPATRPPSPSAPEAPSTRARWILIAVVALLVVVALAAAFLRRSAAFGASDSAQAPGARSS